MPRSAVTKAIDWGRFPSQAPSTPKAQGPKPPDQSASVTPVSPSRVAATSANLTGGPDPKSLDELSDEIRAGAAVVIDGGELPGVPSTVVDLTGPEPQIIREGALPAAKVLERLDRLV